MYPDTSLLSFKLTNSMTREWMAADVPLRISRLTASLDELRATQLFCTSKGIIPSSFIPSLVIAIRRLVSSTIYGDISLEFSSKHWGWRQYTRTSRVRR